MEQKEIQRKNWIDAAKGIAILIVALNHSGLVIPGVNFWGGMFYVPAFFLLAGYTYVHREESYGSFVKRKAKRLLVPYFGANLLLFLFFFAKDLLFGSFRLSRTMVSVLGIFYGRTQLIKTGEGLVIFEAPIPNRSLMLNLNAPTWFLPALFLVLISAEGLYRLLKGNKKKVNLFVAVLSFTMLLYHYLSPFLLPWCVDILPFLLGFFLIGHEFREGCYFEKLENMHWHSKVPVLAGIILIACGSSLFNGSSNLSVSYFGKSVAICMISAISTSYLLFLALRWTEKRFLKVTVFVGRLGRHTLTILCYHYFVMQMFLAAAGAVMAQRGENSGMLWALIQLCSILLSIGACVVLDIIYQKITKD